MFRSNILFLPTMNFSWRREYSTVARTMERPDVTSDWLANSRHAIFLSCHPCWVPRPAHDDWRVLFSTETSTIPDWRHWNSWPDIIIPHGLYQRTPIADGNDENEWNKAPVRMHVKPCSHLPQRIATHGRVLKSWWDQNTSAVDNRRAIPAQWVRYFRWIEVHT